MSKLVLITGILGQDGTYLADLLLKKGYKVVGLHRRYSTPNYWRLDELGIREHENLILKEGDICDNHFMTQLISRFKFDEIYNTAAMSHVGSSFECPDYTMEVDGNAVIGMLEAIRQYSPHSKFYQCSTSVSGDTKVLVKLNGEIQLVEIESLCQDVEKTYYDDLYCLSTKDYKSSWEKVSYVFRHEADDLYLLKGSGGLELKVTGSHSVIVFDNNGKLVEKAVKDIKPRDLLISFLSSNKNTTDNRPVFDIKKYSNKHRFGGIAKSKISEIKITPDLMRLFGFYVAEGSVYKKEKQSARTTFTFHIKEKYYTEDIKNIVKNELGLDGFYETEKLEQNIRRITISNKQLANFLIEHFNTGSHNKKIPNWMFDLDYECFIEFMRGYIGDARIGNKDIRYTSVSKNLIESLCYLCHLNGLSCSIVKRKNKEHLSPKKTIIKESTCYDLKIIGKFANKIDNGKRQSDNDYRFNCNLIPSYLDGVKSYKSSIHKNKLPDKYKSIKNGELCINRVKSIEKLPGTHMVYDLHVPSTQMFFGGNFPLLLHNSELWGNNYTEIDGRKVQNEETPFSPTSPYSIAKLAAHHAISLYREAYGLFAVAGILHNHDSIPGNMAIIIKKNGLIDILPIEDVFKTEKHRYEGIKECYTGAEIWNGTEWTKIIAGTTYKDNKKNTRLVQTRKSCIISTNEHEIFKADDSSIESQNIKVGDVVFKCEYPKFDNLLSFNDVDLAKFIGFLVADGHINKENGKIRLCNCDANKLKMLSEILCMRYGWKYKISTRGPGNFENSTKDVYKSDIQNDKEIGFWLRKNIYTEHSGYKRIPAFILNGAIEVKKSFIEGYFLGDGRKRGHERYEYKGFSSNSSALALGLSWIFNDVIGQVPKVKYKIGYNGHYTFCCQLRSPDSDTTWRGKNKLKELDEVIISDDVKFGDGWFYDLQTESETFCAGPNLFKIHNSPIRGDNFLTRKVTKWIGEFVKWRNKIESNPDNCGYSLNFSSNNIIAIRSNPDSKPYGDAQSWLSAGTFPKLKLGNLDSVRDIGFSKEYVEAMFLMLQQEQPKDYVIGTGVPTTMREFVSYAFEAIGISDWEKYVEIDKSLFRPSEVNYLCADASKAEKELGWKPKTSVKELARMMVETDIRKTQ